MLRPTESRIKFFVKMQVVTPLRSLFLRFFAKPVQGAGWENRMLLVNLEGMGDLVMFTSVLKHYRRRFPGVKLYLLIKSGTGMEQTLTANFVDEVITVNYRRFSTNPLYGARLINRLREIGFARIVNHDFSAAEIMGKIISVSLGAREVIGYEGQEIEFRKPFDFQQTRNLKIVREKIFPRYTRLIPSLRSSIGSDIYLPNAILHYRAVYEAFAGHHEDDYATMLPFRDTPETRSILSKLGLAANRYVVMNVNSSVRSKCWPFDRFARVAAELEHKGLTTVLVGARREQPIAESFARRCSGRVVNAAGATSFNELTALIAHSFLVFTNDTSTVHLAVALRKPSLCVVGGGQFGVAVDYGYRDINRWLYRKTSCFFDNWHCSKTLPNNAPCPCVEAVTADQAIESLHSLVSYLRKTAGYPRERFSIGFFANGESSSPRAPHTRLGRPLKVFYAGIRFENYNPTRKPSFEYVNFYQTLTSMPGVEATEWPYDDILKIGKHAWNEQLLATVKREKPDLFFAFMFTDEFDHGILEEIKRHTTSIAWFADDHWRLDNYSRFYAPHFTWAVTTWSKGPERYAHYGITNIIRSQWACTARVWHIVDTPKDIDVGFVGQYNSARGAIVQTLRDRGIGVWARGWGWPEGRLSQDDIVRAISRSKINLNFNTPPSRLRLKLLARLFLRRSVDRIIPDLLRIPSNIRSWINMGIPQIKARPFEILGCRAFLISGYADDMDRYYKNGEEIVYYDGSIEDLVRKIEHYRKRPEERERIAEAGYERTIREHTYEKRFEELFRKINLA